VQPMVHTDMVWALVFASLGMMCWGVSFALVCSNPHCRLDRSSARPTATCSVVYLGSQAALLLTTIAGL
jgi:hypothetical protein